MDGHEKAESDVIKHRKRVLTPARKEQNRIAQRLYRERQKTRRKNQRPMLLTNALHLRPRPMPAQRQRDAHQPQGHDTAEECARDALAERDPEQSTKYPVDVVRPPFQPTIEEPDALQNLTRLDVVSPSFGPELISQCMPLESGHGIESLTGAGSQVTPEVTSLSWPENTFNSFILNNNQDGRTDTARHATNNTAVNHTGVQTDDGPQITSQNLYPCTLDSSSMMRSSSSSMSLYFPWPSPALSGIYDGSVELEDSSQPLSHRPATSLSHTYTVASEGISPPLPDPWRNNIQFPRTTIFNAFLTIALSLGFNLRDLVDANCLGMATQSPFYRPATPQDDPRALLEAARRPSASSNLQPTLPQILIPHHPRYYSRPFLP
ncbi:hypothetical protein BR93DRAFT_962010 [Coniochaeta sp. PMI_546]|nr:hypothetical protein BR93DRAFT_962010 [Coniochaeta sp. PMI_546]